MTYKRRIRAGIFSRLCSRPRAGLLIGTTEEVEMKKLMLALVLMVGVGQSGCAFLGGAAVGALGTSAGYEINAHNKMRSSQVF